MKLFKKLASFILAFAMVAAIAMPSVVMADDSTYTITITPTTENHTYEAYQIFSGDLSADGKLSNITWGKGIKEDGKAALLSKYEVTTVSELADKLAKFADNYEDTRGFAKEVSQYLQNPAVAKASGTTATISGLAAGYYLVKDQNKSLQDKDETYTDFILKVVKDQTVAPKSEKPISEKKVIDTNDTEGTTSDWQDSADWDIGDMVPFQLKGTVAADYDKYKVYKMTFHDKESEGLTFDKDSVEVFVDGEKITSGYEVVTPANHGDTKDTFDIVFADLKQINDVKAKSVITVEYKSKLNEKAVLGEEGNPNTMHMEFSNNPNDEQGGETGKTPDDKVIVFTYQTVINKVDGDQQPLTGAKFVLRKILNDGTKKEVALVEKEPGAVFTFKGLDDGDYELEETETPAGYNTLSPNPIKFTISAVHEKESNDPKLTSLTGDKVDGNVFTFETSSDKSTLTTNVVNKSGSTLPSTGGMGTTVLYVAGTLMIIAAAAFLVMKKKAENK